MAFAEAHPDESFVQEVLARITWYHNITLLDKVKDPKEREFYVSQTIQHGWSRNRLVHQIEAGLYQRQGKALTNFEQVLPAPKSDLANQILKDPYLFDFLALRPTAHERDLQRALLQHVTNFLLELGVGFALVGSQYRLEVGDQDFFIDLLFYHLRLRCFVAIDLKTGSFEPEHVGKMGFYLSAVDDLLRSPDDEASIGLILCKTRNRMIAEYALRDIGKAPCPSIPLPRIKRSVRPVSSAILAQTRRDTTMDLTLVRSPSSQSGNLRYSSSQTTAPRTASPRNSRRSLLSRREPAIDE